MASPMQRNIVIIGGGIIGCTTAYYLSRHPAFSPSTIITILEGSRYGVAQGASGKAGGLVAKWAYPTELVNVSVPEHERLAQEHGGADRWGYRTLRVGNWEGHGSSLVEAGSGIGKGQKPRSLEKLTGLSTGRNKSRSAKGLPDDLTWVTEELTHSYAHIDGPGDTTQVHPRQFTLSMLELAQEKGVRLVLGRATSIERADGQVTGVKYRSHDEGAEEVLLLATDVVLAAGAWSPSLVPTLAIRGTRAHSITIQTTPEASIAPYALFTEISFRSQRGRGEEVVSPEIYARPAGEVYACGPGDSVPLPIDVDAVNCDAEACKDLHEWVSAISPELAKGEVTARQACYLPVAATNSSYPIIGEVPKLGKHLYMATAHTCWGICNAPGTAKALSELIFDGKISCADLRKLDPAKRLM